MLPTPSTSHVSFNTIYEPAEDSFLLLDTLSSPSETSWLSARLIGPTPLAVEVGTGSGVVIAFLAANAQNIFGRSILTMGVDVNMDACLATRRTAVQAISDQQSRSVYIDSICADLGSTMIPGSVDVLVFNPPYVPTEDLPVMPNLQNSRDKFEHESHLLSLSYAGGKDGMETTNRLLDQIPVVLSKRGVAYVLFCAQNKPSKVKEAISIWPDGPWNAETVGRSGKVAGWEKLEIVRIWKSE
jgi:release factor glutamine methyltransferase